MKNLSKMHTQWRNIKRFPLKSGLRQEKTTKTDYSLATSILRDPS